MTRSPSRVPSVVAALNAAQFQQGFTQRVPGSHDRGIGKDAIHVGSAWAGHARLVLAHRKVGDKLHEITAIPDVLQLLDLDGCTVTVEAMGCQTTLAKQIVRQRANYVLAVKENQKQVYHDVADTFRYAQATNRRNVPHAHLQTVTGAHGRIDVRDYWLTNPRCWRISIPRAAGLA